MNLHSQRNRFGILFTLDWNKTEQQTEESSQGFKAMRPRWIKVLHDLWDNKSRTILAVISIAVGVFSIGVITGAYVIISSDINKSYAANNPMNMEIRTSPVGSPTVSMVKNTRGVAQVEGRYVFDMRVRQPGSNQWTLLSMVAIDDFKKIKINLLSPISGSNEPKNNKFCWKRKS